MARGKQAKAGARAARARARRPSKAAPRVKAVSKVVARARPGSRPAAPAGQVVGLGGVFVKARDGKVTGDFYRSLGVPLGPEGYLTWAWSPPSKAGRAAGRRAPPGYTVFSLFADDSTYFGPSGQRAMVNLRVEGLNALVARLAAAGVTVLPERQDEPYGRFAWILDPDGNRIELWEPTPGPAPGAVPMR